jgi:hypothetical protein
MSLPSRIPAFVSTVDRAAREVRVSIPGITDGDDLLPLASIEYPIGDNPAATEIRLTPGDPIWVVFENGDRRYPIITGYRCPRSGNETGWRRWAHDNIELSADDELHLKCARLIVDATTSVVFNTPHLTVNAQNVDINATTEFSVTSPTSTFNGNAQVNGSLGVAAGTGGGGGINATGNINTTAGNITAPNGDIQAGNISLKTHRTQGVQRGSQISDGPTP